MRRVLYVTALFGIGVPLLGVGVPLGWLWIASQFATLRIGIGYGPLAVLSLGMLFSYCGLTVVAARLDLRERGGMPPRQRSAWNESLSAERRRPTTTTSVERVFLTTVFVVGAAFEVWALLFAHTTFQ